MRLSQDDAFDYELNRVLAHARYGGSDTREVLQLADKINPGDFESWYEAFYDLACRVEASVGPAPDVTASASSRSKAVGQADRLLAASNYYRAADFFLHGNQNDRRIDDIWAKQTECFDRAIALLGRGQRLKLKADDFDVPIIYFQATPLNEPDLAGANPTLIIGNGYDGAMEEMIHVCGFAALERGYNVLLYEGPGQPTVRREQKLGFIHDWERVITPVVDFLLLRPEVDNGKIALFGYSLGGYLCVRAAAFEHRLAAVAAVDGLFEYGSRMRFPLALGSPETDPAGFNERFAKWMFDAETPTMLRWATQHGMWSFNVSTATQFLERASQMDLTEVIRNVRCEVFVGDAEEDMFFKGQPEKLAAALGSKAHLRMFTANEAAGLHCQVGAASLMNAEVFAWLDHIFSTKL